MIVRIPSLERLGYCLPSLPGLRAQCHRASRTLPQKGGRLLFLILGTGNKRIRCYALRFVIISRLIASFQPYFLSSLPGLSR
ncbi:hypothetical protein VN12_10820 [Pirellula sp. SH-Sr6A]|nr:hypothetical protein VN12_10820 [Pirellula sp. SH-Sr6A]